MSACGPWQQVSRLGNPLINEVIIPTAKKDYWNSQKPASDSQFAKYYKAPEITAVANALYDALDTPATTNRNDLVAVLLTGLNIPNSATVPGGLQFTRTGLDPGRHAPRQHRHQAERGRCLRLRCRPVAAPRAGWAPSMATCAASPTAGVSSTT